MRRRILVLALTLCVVFSIIPIAASAESAVVDSGTCGDNLTWVLTEDGILTISGEGEMEGYPIAYPGWYEHRSVLTKAVIQDGVTNIGESAFYNCTSLASVILADSVKEIGVGAFYKCSNLADINLQSVRTIRNNAFGFCALTEVIIPDGVDSLEFATFMNCTELTSITFPESIVSVDNGAFNGCTSLTNVTIPRNVAIIIHDAFEGTPYHQSITDSDGFSIIEDVLVDYSGVGGDIAVPDCVTYIGDSAFYNCSNITSITLPDSVTTIGNNALYQCTNMTAVTLSENLKSIGDSAFGTCWRLKEIKIPDATVSIGAKCFGGCGFTSLTIPKNLTSIGEDAFFGIHWLEKIVVETDNPAYSSQYGILFNKDMTELIKIPEGKMDLGFEYEIPASVERIAKGAFAQCEAPSYVIIHENVTYIHPLAFERCFGLYGFEVDPANPAYRSVDGVLFDEEMTTLMVFPFRRAGSYIIPDGVVHIAESAFDNVQEVSYISIPASVKTIGNSGFSNSKICGLVFAGDAPTLGRYALPQNVGIYYPEGNSTWNNEVKQSWGESLTWIAYTPESPMPPLASGTCGESAEWTLDLFDETLTISGTGPMDDYVSTYEGGHRPEWYDYENVIRNVVIEDGITTVGDYSFADCYNLREVVLPIGLTSIGESAFAACYNLQEVSFPLGDAPTIGTDAFNDVTATAYYPADNSTWNADVMQDYGGNIIWVAVSDRPAVPTVKATNVASTGKIKLTWNAVDGAAKYMVYRSTDKENWTLLKTTTGTSLTNTSTTAGSLYYYYVVAVAADGTESDPSTIISRRCDLAQPVVTLSNIASSGKIKISWKKIEGAVKYEVYRSTDKENWTLLKTTTGTSLTNTSTTAGTLYYYKVKAIASNSGANSAFSAVKSRRCDLAQPVVTLSNVASSGKIKISWKKIEGAVKYEVYRSADKENWTLLKTVTGTSLTNTSTTAGKLYYYKVRAIASNSEANSAYSTVKSRTCDLARPTLTVTKNSKGQPYLSWTKVTGAVKYKVYRSTDGENWTLLKTTTGTKLTNSSVTSGKTYYYKVLAVASVSSANSAYSTVKSVTAG